jgi:hypothetical protein
MPAGRQLSIREPHRVLFFIIDNHVIESVSIFS